MFGLQASILGPLKSKSNQLLLEAVGLPIGKFRKPVSLQACRNAELVNWDARMSHLYFAFWKCERNSGRRFTSKIYEHIMTCSPTTTFRS